MIWRFWKWRYRRRLRPRSAEVAAPKLPATRVRRPGGFCDARRKGLTRVCCPAFPAPGGGLARAEGRHQTGDRRNQHTAKHGEDGDSSDYPHDPDHGPHLSPHLPLEIAQFPDLPSHPGLTAAQFPDLPSHPGLTAAQLPDLPSHPGLIRSLISPAIRV